LIDRVVNNVANNKFTLKLNLEDSDPIGFLKLYRKLQRLSNRDETLFNQQLQSTKSNIINPVEFCELYCAISTNYLSLAKTLQPSNASGFEEIAKVEATHDAKNNLKEIITYYNKESGIIQLDLFQNIFNNSREKVYLEFAEDISRDLANDRLIIIGAYKLGKSQEIIKFVNNGGFKNVNKKRKEHISKTTKRKSIRKQCAERRGKRAGDQERSGESAGVQERAESREQKAESSEQQAANRG
jgi:hypothetical protein